MKRNLTKRILSLLLALVLFISSAPAAVFATEEETAQIAEEAMPRAVQADLVASIEQQIRAFARSIDKPNADDDAATAIAKHGISGGGKTLNAGKNHALTATLMNWVSQGMKEDPEIMVKRTGRLLDGMIEKTLSE